MLTKEQFEKLIPFEKELLTAYKSQFIRNVNAPDFEIVKEIYLELSKSEEVFKLQCSSCIINLYSKMGRIYQDYKLANKVEPVETEWEIIKEVVTVEPVKEVEPVAPVKEENKVKTNGKTSNKKGK